jgi:hypothetical protein
MSDDDNLTPAEQHQGALILSLETALHLARGEPCDREALRLALATSMAIAGAA